MNCLRSDNYFDVRGLLFTINITRSAHPEHLIDTIRCKIINLYHRTWQPGGSSGLTRPLDIE